MSLEILINYEQNVFDVKLDILAKLSFFLAGVVILLNYIETTATHTSSKVMILLRKLWLISFLKIISPQAGGNTTKTQESERE